MELDEMKNAWRELDQRLDRQQTLSETFIRESISARSQRSVNKFLNVEIIGAAAILAAIPLIVRQHGMPWTEKIPGLRILLVANLVLLLLLFVWQLIKILPLFKIEMSKSVSDNIACVKRYERYALREKRATIISAPPLFIALFIWRASVSNDAPWYWALLAGIVIIGALFTVWYYKKFFANNMRAIKRGLEELKDL